MTTNVHGQPTSLCPVCDRPALITPGRDIDGKHYHRPCYINTMKRINAERNRTGGTK
jgi:hypothetical protein